LTHLLADPSAWAALAALVVMEIVLGIDNLVFIAIVTNRLPPERQPLARRLGIGLSLVMRLVLLATVSFIVRLTDPLFSVFHHAFSWRDLIMIGGGGFLIWKATSEIHGAVDASKGDTDDKDKAPQIGFSSAIMQILALDVIFSLDSVITAVGMTDDFPVMALAIVIAVITMLVAANPVANFIARNPTIVMLALSFLLLIGTTLVADGFGVHVPKGYIYAAMAFSGLVETLNTVARKRRNSPRNA